MFVLLRNLIGYTGSGYNNIDSYILNACIVLILVFFVVLIDLVYKLIRSFIRGR